MYGASWQQMYLSAMLNKLFLMFMKLSRYTLFFSDQGKNYIYHQASNALLKVDEELYDVLKGGNLQVLSEDVWNTLEQSGFLIKDSIDETCSIRYGNLIGRYNSKLMRITILPTLSCNFRCWYCYEQHKVSIMTESGAKSVLGFIKSEILKKHLEHVVLDWFGGEPLLRFSQVIYPLSKELKTWCRQNNVNFSNIITTNGSLINEDMAVKMNEIGLRQFQITLDGDKDHHNKVRFSSTMKNSYDVIVSNIHTLCRTVEDPNIELRINYTTDNIDTAKSILYSFDADIRQFIHIFPQIVWQESGKRDVLSYKEIALKNKALEEGYSVDQNVHAHRCSGCYVENMEQFVVNYDLNVYKCTARDYNGKYSVGRISEDGQFVPNELYYKYYTTPSPFLRKECLECEFLPSCLFSIACIQKTIEGYTPKCNKDLVKTFVYTIIKNKIRLKK